MTFERPLAPGVVEQTMNGAETVVHLARLSAAAAGDLQPVLASDHVSVAMQPTSETCRRVSCVVAVNGDFGDVASGEPIGGFVGHGRLARSPNGGHEQLTRLGGGGLAAGFLGWSGRVAPVAGAPVGVDGVNVKRPSGQVVLYTPDYGPTTETDAGGVEIELHPASWPLPLGQPVVLTATALHDGPGNTALAGSTVVLSGRDAGADRLRVLWADMHRGGRADVTLTLDAGGATWSLGGHPVLVRDGTPLPLDQNDTMVTGRHPRTLVGWTSAGDVFLVTVDGRQPGYSMGMTLAEASDFMRSLGATNAINLDGGGSTTFVVNGDVRNRPSDSVNGRRNVERAVTEALVFVPRPLAVTATPAPPAPVAAPAAAPAPAPPPAPAAAPVAPPPAVPAPAPLPPPQPVTTTTVAAAAPPAPVEGRDLLAMRYKPPPPQRGWWIALSATLVATMSSALTNRRMYR